MLGSADDALIVVQRAIDPQGGLKRRSSRSGPCDGPVQRAIDPQGGLKRALRRSATRSIWVQRAIDPQGGLKPGDHAPVPGWLPGSKGH